MNLFLTERHKVETIISVKETEKLLGLKWVTMIQHGTCREGVRDAELLGRKTHLELQSEEPTPQSQSTWLMVRVRVRVKPKPNPRNLQEYSRKNGNQGLPNHLGGTHKTQWNTCWRKASRFVKPNTWKKNTWKKTLYKNLARESKWLWWHISNLQCLQLICYRHQPLHNPAFLCPIFTYYNRTGSTLTLSLCLS